MKRQQVEEACIKAAGKIARAINGMGSYNIYPQCDSSHSFTGPFFPLTETDEHTIDWILEQQISYFSRKFSRYRHINFHDVRVTFLASKGSLYHSPPMDIGYFRIDYIAIDKLKIVGTPVLEDRYALYHHQGELHLAAVDDFRAIVMPGDPYNSQVTVRLASCSDRYFSPKDILFSELLYFVDGEELIATDAHYCIKDTIFHLTNCDKSSSARILFNNAQAAGIAILPEVHPQINKDDFWFNCSYLIKEGQTKYASSIGTQGRDYLPVSEAPSFAHVGDHVVGEYKDSGAQISPDKIVGTPSQVEELKEKYTRHANSAGEPLDIPKVKTRKKKK